MRAKTLALAGALVLLVLSDVEGQPRGGGQGVALAGARSSACGIRPFPSPEGWTSAEDDGGQLPWFDTDRHLDRGPLGWPHYGYQHGVPASRRRC